MIIPQILSKGDSVYFCNIARKGDYDESFVSQLFENWGLKIILGETITSEGFCQFAADESTRLKDFQYAIDDPEIKAIFFLRGGYGTIQILDKIDFSGFCKTSKMDCWLQRHHVFAHAQQ